MNKRIRMLISLLLCVLLAAFPLLGQAEETPHAQLIADAMASAPATFPEESDGTYAGYADAGAGYAFAYPKGWTSATRTGFVSLSSPSGQSVIELGFGGDLGKNVSDEELLSYSEAFSEMFLSSNTAFQAKMLEGSGTLLTLPVGGALQLLYTFTNEGKDCMGALYILCVDTRMFQIRLTADASEAEDCCVALGEVLGSLNLV